MKLKRAIEIIKEHCPSVESLNVTQKIVECSSPPTLEEIKVLIDVIPGDWRISSKDTKYIYYPTYPTYPSWDVSTGTGELTYTGSRVSFYANSTASSN